MNQGSAQRIPDLKSLDESRLHTMVWPGSPNRQNAPAGGTSNLNRESTLMPESILDAAFLKKLERLSLVTKRPFAGQMKGEKRSVKRGTSVEFADYREYI